MPINDREIYTPSKRVLERLRRLDRRLQFSDVSRNIRIGDFDLQVLGNYIVCDEDGETDANPNMWSMFPCGKCKVMPMRYVTGDAVEDILCGTYQPPTGMQTRLVYDAFDVYGKTLALPGEVITLYYNQDVGRLETIHEQGLVRTAKVEIDISPGATDQVIYVNVVDEGVVTQLELEVQNGNGFALDDFIEVYFDPAYKPEDPDDCGLWYGRYQTGARCADLEVASGDGGDDSSGATFIYNVFLKGRLIIEDFDPANSLCADQFRDGMQRRAAVCCMVEYDIGNDEWNVCDLHEEPLNLDCENVDITASTSVLRWVQNSLVSKTASLLRRS